MHSAVPRGRLSRRVLDLTELREANLIADRVQVHADCDTGEPNCVEFALAPVLSNSSIAEGPQLVDVGGRGRVIALDV
jgi:hypothetical protein